MPERDDRKIWQNTHAPDGPFWSDPDDPKTERLVNALEFMAEQMFQIRAEMQVIREHLTNEPPSNRTLESRGIRETIKEDE